MKAVSPLIATVLLIAFTVAAGGIISAWLTTLTGSSTGTVGTAVDKTVLCSNSVISIKEVSGQMSTSTIQNDTFNITVVYDYGSEALYGFNLSFVSNAFDSETVQPTPGKNFNKTTPFKPGQLTVFNLDINSTDSVIARVDLAGTSLSRVTVTAMCQGTFPVQAECKAGHDCMKA